MFLARIGRSKRGRVVILAGVTLGLVLLAASLYRSLCSDLAHVALARWAFVPGQAKAESQLFAALEWGEKAGDAWTADRLGHNQQAQRLGARMQSQVVLARQRAQGAYDQGLSWERQEELALALESYQQAFADDGRWVEAGYKVYDLGMQLGQAALAQPRAQALYTLSPEYPVSTSLAAQARLLGYDLDEMSLERGVDPIPVTFYWELPGSPEGVSRWQADGWVYVRVQNRLYQLGTLDNILPNGGFERDLSTMAIVPAGYQDAQAALIRDRRDYVDLLRTRHRLDLDQAGEYATQVAVVVSSNAAFNGLTTLYKLSVKAGSLYVMGGRMRVTEAGNGYLGGIWRTDPTTDLLYWHVARERPAQAWQHIAAAARAPEGATVFVPLFLNMGAGQVYFDDLVLFQVPVPGGLK
ncbi:MAG: hypothetical protein JW850_20060 [Thermoflexales bacterium]|nr:hypothetical protein [Thermoflexales bacterium]